ncbi:MAG: hypothetical protein FIB01_06885 [Gemmatimonadetes bacterium]|nr:hypothetical protein [Gemmatimonadota bacterium]
MGFCGKNIELAAQLLYEAERDPGPRGRRLHELGATIIDSFAETLPMSPPVGDGFDLFTGKVAPAVWSVGQQFIRTVAEPMRDLMDAYRREQALGTEHPEWLRWAQDFSDWLVTQQRPDGSFPRSWNPGTSEVANPDGSATYAAPPILVATYQEMGGEAPSAGNAERYLAAAVRAGESLWATAGTRGRFQGGAVDASSVSVKVDGEAGYLSMRAFLALYEATQHPKWLERAKVAADFTESWVWIWNVPMPADAKLDEIHWKPGVSTIGLSSITVASRGSVHVYLSWAAPMYVQLYEYTKDEHYLDVARVLLHGIDPMLELPGRSYGLFLGPGWVQEHWGMSENRGYGQPGKWLPWLATVRLHAIMGIEQQDPSLLEQLVK